MSAAHPPPEDDGENSLSQVTLSGDPRLPGIVLALVISKIGPIVFHRDQLSVVEGTGLVISEEPGTGIYTAQLVDMGEAMRRAGVPEKKDMN